MTTTDPTRLPDAVLRGDASEDPTAVIPVIPVVPPQYRPAPPPVPNPYGPPAGLGYPPPPGFGPAPRRSHRGRVIGVIAAAAVLVVLVVSGALGARTMEVSGTFQLYDTGSSYYGLGAFTSGSSCSGDGGYSDIHTGTAVTISDASGKIIATGSLSSGSASSRLTCDFLFTVPDVPAGEDFYRIEVSHRGEITFTEANAGDLQLSLGS